MGTALLPFFVLLAGLIVWIISLKQVPWPDIGRILFTVGTFFTVWVLAKVVVHFP